MGPLTAMKNIDANRPNFPGREWTVGDGMRKPSQPSSDPAVPAIDIYVLNFHW